MGAAAAGGVQDPSIPRGYQPNDVGVLKVSSPMQFQDEDGTWGANSGPAKSAGVSPYPLYSNGPAGSFASQCEPHGSFANASPPARRLPSFNTDAGAAYGSSSARPYGGADGNRFGGSMGGGATGYGGAGYGGAGGGGEPQSFNPHVDIDDVRIPSPAGSAFPLGAPRNDSVLPGPPRHDSAASSARMHAAMDSFASDAIYSRAGGRDDAASDWGAPPPFRAGDPGNYGGGDLGSNYGGPKGSLYPMSSANYGGGHGDDDRYSVAHSTAASDCIGRTGAVPGAQRPAPQGSLQQRDSWEVGSIVEAFSASTGRWFIARVMEVQPGADGQEVLTAQFYMEEEAKQKSMYRDDTQMQPLGTHCAGDLPPGFHTKPSQSRPGQLVYMDGTTNVKYGSAELAWRVHFERLLEGPPVGCQTVCAVPGNKAMSMSGSPNAYIAAMVASPARAGGQGISPNKPMSLAQLEASHFDGPDMLGDGASQSPSIWGSEMGTPATQQFGGPPQGGGKIGLPSFGDAMGSQAAYLSYEGLGTQANAASAMHGVAPPSITPTTSGYPATRASAPRRPAPVRNPVLQTWQEDPFSQWRQ